MSEGFHLRHRGLHVPDHLRRLELVTNGPGSPTTPTKPASSSGASPRRMSSFRPLAVPKVHIDLIPRSPRAVVSSPRHEGNVALDDHLATVFGNLKVWMENALNMSRTHAGYDKIHLYVLFLRCFVSEVIPFQEMKRLLDDVQEYVSHLSNAAVSPRNVVIFRPPELSNIRTSPHQPSRRITTILSPRAMRSMAAEASATSLSPRIPPKRPKKIIQLSDHEESILELALFYEEAMKQMTGAQQKKKSMQFWTERWLLVPSRTKTKVLKSVKAKLSRGSFFSNAVGRESTPQRSQSSSSTVRVPDRSQLKHDTLFSIVVLCLQESIRSVSVLSSDAAVSAWQVLCEDTLKRVEETLDLVIEQRGKLQDQLEEMKNSRASVRAAIRYSEHEIERLQGVNIRSFARWKREEHEALKLEEEERWHGHCKSLIFKSLHQLQEDAIQATWLQVRAPIKTEMEPSEAVDDCDEEPKYPTHDTLDYQRLPAGSAILHFRVRAQVAYIAHLMVLCRSFLHLEVLRSAVQGGPTESDGGDGDNPSPRKHNPMDRISLEELQTLREISDALRSFEVLYARADSSEWGRAKLFSLHRASQNTFQLHQNDVCTQFPTHESGGKSKSFLTSLTYCTMAVNTFSMASTFVRAGKAIRARPDIQAAHFNIPVGSGRRRRSSLVRSQDAIDAQPLLRMAKAMAKLPKHIKSILILPLLTENPFPNDDPRSNVPAMAKKEIGEQILWIFDMVIGTSSSRDSMVGASNANSTMVPVSLRLQDIIGGGGKEFVSFVHGLFIDITASDVYEGESKFIRLIASIQITFSSTAGSASSSVSSLSTASSITDTIQFFARMLQLYQNKEGVHQPLPVGAFTVFFSCLRIFQQVAVVKKHFNEDGMAMDVWIHPGHQDMSPRMSSIRRERNQSRSSPTSSYVLLESAKTVLVYLLDSTVSDAEAIIQEYCQLLSGKAALAKVALVSTAVPGDYGSSASGPVGDLTDTFIVPLHLAAYAIVNAWIHINHEIVDRLSRAMRAARVQRTGEISFEEFNHVITFGSGSAAHNMITTTQLARIYAAACPEGQTGVRWQELVQAVAEDFDFLGTEERLASADFRSIQLTLLRGGSCSLVSPWLTGPKSYGGDTAGLRRTWDLTRGLMRENLALAIQGENAIHGLKLWQVGNERMDKVEGLLNSRRSFRVENSGSTGLDILTSNPKPRASRGSIHSKRSSAASRNQDSELTREELTVAWLACYYAQVEHSQAHQIADQVRAKQQHNQRGNGYH